MVFVVFFAPCDHVLNEEYRRFDDFDEAINFRNFINNECPDQWA